MELLHSRRLIGASVLILGALVGGYALGTSRGSRPEESVPGLPVPTPASSTPESVAPASSSVSLEESTRIVTLETIRGAADVFPRPALQTTRELASPLPVLEPAESPRIAFVNLPAEARAGTSFTVQWRIDGPSGLRGERTTLRTTYNTSSSSGGSHSSANSSTEQSFGSFMVPRTFSARVSFGGSGSSVNLHISAEVGGRSVSAEATVRLL